MISVSRIYAIDDIETCILAQGDNAQGLLREVEKAAEQLGAAPAALSFSGSGVEKVKRGRKPKGDETAVTQKAPEPAPALPSGVSAAFPEAPSEPPLGQPPMPYYDPPVTASLPAAPAVGPDSGSVAWGLNPPVQFGSQVGLAPPAPMAPAAGPPVFATAPPAPPVDPLDALRKTVSDEQTSIIQLVSTRAPQNWMDAVASTMNAIVVSHGGDLRKMSEDALAATLGEFRQYEDVLKRSLGVM